MQQRVFAETLEQAEDVVNGQAALASVNELDGAAVLQIDAGDDHALRRTGTPFEARNRFNSPRPWMAS